MVKITLEPPKPLSPQRRQQLLRSTRIMTGLIGALLVVGALLGDGELPSGARPALVVLGAALVVVALRASDATIATIQKWWPFY